MRAYGFKHGGRIYLSDDHGVLVEKVVELRANIVAGEPIEPKRFVERVDARALEVLSRDYPVTDLDSGVEYARGAELRRGRGLKCGRCGGLGVRSSGPYPDSGFICEGCGAQDLDGSGEWFSRGEILRACGAAGGEV